MTEYQWAIVRADAIKRFGEFPRPETETEIVEAFKLRPGFVVQAIEQVALLVDAGKVRSGWAILRKRLQDPGPSLDVTVTDASDRESAIRKARSWIRNAGVHCDLEREVADELFGDRGQLRYWDEPPLRAEMLSLWKEQRPRGEKAEALALEWDEACRDATKRLKAEWAKKREKEGLLIPLPKPPEVPV